MLAASPGPKYNAHFGGDLDYDEDAGGDCCAGCAIATAESNIDLGRAIDMMNGDVDDDDDFVTQHLSWRSPDLSSRIPLPTATSGGQIAAERRTPVPTGA